MGQLDQLLQTEPARPGAAIGPASRWNPLAPIFERIKESNLSRQFWVFFAVAFFFDFGFAVYFFLFNLYLVDLHFTERTIGLVGGALTFGSVVGTLPAGWIARRIGLRPLLVCCLVFAPVVGVLRALAPWETAQVALAFLAGLVMCLWGVCFLPTIAGLTTEKNRASAFSLIFSVSIGTSALGGLACGYLPGWLNSAGYVLQAVEVKRLILLVSCATAALGLAPALFLRRPSSPDEPAEAGLAESLRKPWKLHPFLLRFLPAMALWTAVLAAFTPFANVYLSNNLHIPLSRIGLIFSAAQVVQLLLGLFTPVLFRWFGLVNGIVATQIATAAAVGCLAGTRNPSLAIALYLTFSATQWMSSPGLYNLLMSKTPEPERSTAAAVTLFSNALLQSAATAIAGILFAQFGYPRVLAGIAVLALAAALLFVLLVAPADRRAAPQP